MPKRRLLGVEAFVFVLVALITVMVLSIYRMVRPELQLPYNFNPFPSVSPKDLPNAQTGGGECTAALTPCDPLEGCSRCGEEDYECTHVVDSDKYVFNNMDVPPGDWCLPKRDPRQPCNTYTGRWTWVTDPEICPQLNGKSQCWKCLCLYPRLFDGPSTGCTAQKACRNLSEKAERVAQTKNRLVGAAGTRFAGKVWDPRLGNTDVLSTSPYAVDSSTKKPIFQCECDSGSRIPFVRLPGDPYTCHIDPCYEYGGYGHAGAECSEDGCKCDCDRVSGSIEAPWGDFKGKCLQESDVCKNGVWDKINKTCNCPGGVALDCKSDYVPGSVGPECPDNPLGKECVYPCSPNPCQNGAKCTIVKSGEACPSGHQPCPVPGVAGASTCCECPSSGVFTYNGKCCSNECIKDGVKKSETCSYGRGASHTQVFYVGKCCNGSYIHGKGGFGVSCTSTICGPNPHPKSCFTAGTKVVMADGSLKSVEDIRVGEKVRSARTGEAVDVLFLDEEFLGDRRLVGVNGGEPFATEDHCFFGPNGERIVANPIMSCSSKHWSEVRSLGRGACLLEWDGRSLSPSFTREISLVAGDWNLAVYDVITEDHSYIAGGFAVHDDMPELEKHIGVSMKILELLRICDRGSLQSALRPKRDGESWMAIQEFSAGLYREHCGALAGAAGASSDAALLFKEFIALVSKDKRFLNIASSLWRQFMPELASV